MKRITLALAVLVSFAVAAAAHADTTPPPFPANQVNGVFVGAMTTQTPQAGGAVNDQFAPGDTVVFRAFAADTKRHALITKLAAKLHKKHGKLTKKSAKDAKTALKSFFVRIPLVPDIPLKYGPVPAGIDPRYRWSGNWAVPALYPMGVVQFEIFAKMWNKQSGTFTQVPISLSQLTISATPQLPPGPGPTTQGSVTSSNLDVVLFGDAVAGHSRPVACTQTNVFHQGEMVIARAFGYQLGDGAVLTMDNTSVASPPNFTVPGPSGNIVTAMNWGAHGTAPDKFYYWTGAWTIPADYPLGDINVHMTFTTATGKTGTLDYPITIIPA